MQLCGNENGAARIVGSMDILRGRPCACRSMKPGAPVAPMEGPIAQT